MPDPSTLAFDLTYAGTLAVALLMFLGQLAAFTDLLAIVGNGQAVGPFCTGIDAPTSQLTQHDASGPSVVNSAQQRCGARTTPAT